MFYVFKVFYEVSFGENYFKNLVLYVLLEFRVFFKEVNDNFFILVFFNDKLIKGG